MNEDPVPEYSGDVCAPEEHQIRQDEHGGGESREQGEAAPLHRRRNIPLLGNRQKKSTWITGDAQEDFGAVISQIKHIRALK